jgi:NAD-dependent dihydropyrimidine dehydrogenase PreA subunit
MARVTKIKVHGGNPQPRPLVLVSMHGILQQPDRRNRMKKEEFDRGGKHTSGTCVPVCPVEALKQYILVRDFVEAMFHHWSLSFKYNGPRES